MALTRYLFTVLLSATLGFIGVLEASPACENQTQICTKKLKGVQDLFAKGDFSYFVDHDNRLTLNCSGSFLEEIYDCMKKTRTECNGLVADHPKIYYSAYNYICKNRQDFIDANHCFHSEEFVKVLMHCGKLFGAKDTICRKFPSCLQKEISETHDCTSKHSRTAVGLIMETLKLKFPNC